MLAAPQDHALSSGKEPEIADLDGQDFVMWSPLEARYFFDLVTGLCATALVVPRHVQFITQTHTMLALVGAGLGLALVPEAARTLHFGGVVLRPIRCHPPAVAELHLVWRRDASNPALPGFRDAILQRFAAAGGRPA